MSKFVAIHHSRFHRVQREVFYRRVTADCMNHTCRLRKQKNRKKLDACCQYGADVDLAERDAILEHAGELRALLDDPIATNPWFTVTPTPDADFPSGMFVRTRTYDKGCVFLHHDGRGCSIHRAALAGKWDMNGVKPHVCRLFPLSYDTQAIVLSDDYDDYSCAQDVSAPTVYRVGRSALGDIFGQALVEELDRVEEQLCSTSSTNVPPIALG